MGILTSRASDISLTDEQLCEAMGYSAGRHGKHNMQNANRTILFNFSDFDRQFYLKIIQGISDYVYAMTMICLFAPQNLVSAL